MIEGKSTPSTGDDAADAGGRIIDVDRGSDVPSWFGYAIGISSAGALVIALAVVVAILGYDKHRVIVGIVIGSTVGLAAFVVAGAMKRKTRQRVAWDEDLTDGDLVRRIMDGTGWIGSALKIWGVRAG